MPIFQGNWPNALKEGLKGRCACEYGYNFNSKDGQCVKLKVRVKRESGTKKEQKGFTVKTVAIMILGLLGWLGICCGCFWGIKYSIWKKKKKDQERMAKFVKFFS